MKTPIMRMVLSTRTHSIPSGTISTASSSETTLVAVTAASAAPTSPSTATTPRMRWVTTLRGAPPGNSRRIASSSDP